MLKVGIPTSAVASPRNWVRQILSFYHRSLAAVVCRDRKTFKCVYADSHAIEREGEI